MLADKHKNILRLIRRSTPIDGWYKVSGVVWPLLADTPSDLVEKRPSEDGGMVRLTPRGEAVADYLI